MFLFYQERVRVLTQLDKYSSTVRNPHEEAEETFWRFQGDINRIRNLVAGLSLLFDFENASDELQLELLDLQMDTGPKEN
jgi:hypothetical protein